MTLKEGKTIWTIFTHCRNFSIDWNFANRRKTILCYCIDVQFGRLCKEHINTSRGKEITFYTMRYSCRLLYRYNVVMTHRRKESMKQTN